MTSKNISALNFFRHACLSTLSSVNSCFERYETVRMCKQISVICGHLVWLSVKKNAVCLAYVSEVFLMSQYVDVLLPVRVGLFYFFIFLFFCILLANTQYWSTDWWLLRKAFSEHLQMPEHREAKLSAKPEALTALANKIQTRPMATILRQCADPSW